MLVPKLVSLLNGYTRAQFTADMTAGVIVYGIVHQHGVNGLQLGAVPPELVALIVTTVLVKVLGLSVETIGSRFSAISASIPIRKSPRCRSRR